VERFIWRLERAAASAPEGARQYLALRAYLDACERLALYSSDFRAQLMPSNADELYLRQLPHKTGRATLSDILRLDTATFLPDLNLLYGDKMTMAASIEMRVPFIDNALVDLALAAPVQAKMRGLVGKRVLREAVAGVVPPSVIKRRKAAFAAPVRTWLRDGLKEMVGDLLSPAALRRRGYFDDRAVQTLIAEHQRQIADHSHVLWALLTLEIWHQVFIDRKDGS